MWIDAVIARLKYKPNLRFTFDHQFESGIVIFGVAMKVASVIDGTMTEVVVKQYKHESWPFEKLELHNREWQIVDMYRDLVQRIELHEMREWLTYDGEHVADPHPRG